MRDGSENRRRRRWYEAGYCQQAVEGAMAAVRRHHEPEVEVVWAYKEIAVSQEGGERFLAVGPYLEPTFGLVTLSPIEEPLHGLLSEARKRAGRRDSDADMATTKTTTTGDGDVGIAPPRLMCVERLGNPPAAVRAHGVHRSELARRSPRGDDEEDEPRGRGRGRRRGRAERRRKAGRAGAAAT